jgi:hypothetical protein
MTKETSTSILSADDITKHIKKELNTKGKVTDFRIHFNNRDTCFSDIYAEVESEREGFVVNTPYRYSADDICVVCNTILKEKELEVEEIHNKHGSPILAGYTKIGDKDVLTFKGVRFRWKD